MQISVKKEKKLINMLLTNGFKYGILKLSRGTESEHALVLAQTIDE